jgi:hypothetical protein
MYQTERSEFCGTLKTIVTTSKLLTAGKIKVDLESLAYLPKTRTL